MRRLDSQTGPSNNGVKLLGSAPDGTRSIVPSGLRSPGGMTIGPDGALYVSNFGIFPGIGEIRRIVVP